MNWLDTQTGVDTHHLAQIALEVAKSNKFYNESDRKKFTLDTFLLECELKAAEEAEIDEEKEKQAEASLEAQLSGFFSGLAKRME